MSDSDPKIILFCCNWGSEAVADLAGTSGSRIKPYFRVIRTMCSGRVDPSFILHAFAGGADGVMVTGCHPGDCHYTGGNYKTWRRIMLLKQMLPQLGIDPERLKLEWISPSEASKFHSAVNEFADRIIALGAVY